MHREFYHVLVIKFVHFHFDTLIFSLFPIPSLSPHIHEIETLHTSLLAIGMIDTSYSVPISSVHP